ncbi:MAG: YihY family inner membrane protein [Burkholderiales bacterium]
MTGKSPTLPELVHIVVRRFYEDRCLQIAASLAFTTLLAIVPLITVTLTLISAFPVFAKLSQALQRFVVEHLVPTAAGAVAGYAEQFSANAAKLTAVGAVFLVVTAIVLLMTIERAFNQIWRVSRQRPLFQRVLVYWTLLTIGPLLVGASLSLTSWLVSLSLGMVSDIPGAAVAVLRIVPVVLTSVALALLYLALPNRRVVFRDALLGGLMAGFAFEAMKRGFAFYIMQFPSYELVYGAFASVPVFLLWVYLSWLVVLSGAVVVAALPEWRARAGHARRLPGDDFFDAVQILKTLWHAHRRGEVVRLPQLHGTVRTGIERIEAILDTMSGAGWVGQVASAGWVLGRDPATIKVEDVYRLFVFNADAGDPARAADAGLEALVRDISLCLAEHMQLSIEDLLRRTEQPAAPQPLLPSKAD